MIIKKYKNKALLHC